MNETIGQALPDELALGYATGILVAAFLAWFFGIVVGLVLTRPSTLRRSVLREALDLYTGSRDLTTEERRRVALQMRHGRLLRERFDDE